MLKLICAHSFRVQLFPFFLVLPIVSSDVIIVRSLWFQLIRVQGTLVRSLDSNNLYYIFISPIERLKTINPGAGAFAWFCHPTPGNLPIFFFKRC